MEVRYVPEFRPRYAAITAGVKGVERLDARRLVVLLPVHRPVHFEVLFQGYLAVSVREITSEIGVFPSSLIEQSRLFAQKRRTDRKHSETP